MKYDQIALHSWIEEQHWWFVARRQIILHLIRQIMPPSKNKLVIDIGCGTGANIAEIAKYYSGIGIDISEEAIQLAKRRFGHVDFICASAPRELGKTMGKANLILLTDMLEHVQDDLAFFSKILAATPPQSHLLLTVPADPSLWCEHDISFGHYRRYDLEGFKRIWADFPVTTRLVSYYNSRLYLIIKIMRTLSRWRGRAFGLVGTDFRLLPKPLNLLLTYIFAGESKVLMTVLDKPEKQGFSKGASLISILRREQGAITCSSKPYEYVRQSG